jgi:hypothetical protein
MMWLEGHDMKHVLLSALLALGVASQALAHHSWAGFSAEPITFDGHIESVRIENPHAVIEIRGTDNERYVVVWGAINALTRMGYRIDGPGGLREMLKVGDILVVTGRSRPGDKTIEIGPTEIIHKVHGVILKQR